MLTYNEKNTQEQSIFYATTQTGPAAGEEGEAREEMKNRLH